MLVIVRDVFNDRFSRIEPFMGLGSFRRAGLARSRFLNQHQNEKRQQQAAYRDLSEKRRLRYSASIKYKPIK